MATAVATAASSNSEKVVGAAGFEPPTSCSQSIDEGAELPSFWDALTGETARDEERWLPWWPPQATQPVERLIRNQHVSGSIPLRSKSFPVEAGTDWHSASHALSCPRPESSR